MTGRNLFAGLSRPFRLVLLEHLEATFADDEAQASAAGQMAAFAAQSEALEAAFDDEPVGRLVAVPVEELDDMCWEPDDDPLPEAELEAIRLEAAVVVARAAVEIDAASAPQDFQRPAASSGAEGREPRPGGASAGDATWTPAQDVVLLRSLVEDHLVLPAIGVLGRSQTECLARSDALVGPDQGVEARKAALALARERAGR